MNRDRLVKICGQTDAATALACEAAGADLLGFIFHPPSPRHVSAAFAASVRPRRARKVGVFVRQKPDEIRGIMDQAGLDLAQLHGDHAPEDCALVGAERVIRAFWPARHASREALLREMERFADAAAWFLLDGGVSGGGHGHPQDAALLSGLRPPRPWFLAGGLGPANLAFMLSGCDPDGVDLNSGVESAPGVKDMALVEAACALLRQG